MISRPKRGSPARNLSASASAPGPYLQTLIRDAVALLAPNPKDRKLHRALWHTFFEPAPTQEQAAELLDLPFNTYRYHLSRGIERVSTWLRQRPKIMSTTCACASDICDLLTNLSTL